MRITIQNHHSRDEIVVHEDTILDETTPLLRKHPPAKDSAQTLEQNRPENIYFYHHITSSVLPRILFPMFIFFIWSMAVRSLIGFGILPLSILPKDPNWLVCINAAISLLLVFRTNSAYARYNEAQSLLTKFKATWQSIHILFRQSLFHSSKETESTLKTIVEKLLLGYFVSVIKLLENKDINDPSLTADPRLTPVITLASKLSQGNLVMRDEQLPLEQIPRFIIEQLACIIISQKSWDRSTIVSSMSLLNGLTDTYSHLERIKTTFSPFAYVIHVNQIVFLYLFCLPLELESGGYHGWTSVFFTVLVSFVFLGVEALAQMLASPFTLMRLHSQVPL